MKEPFMRTVSYVTALGWPFFLGLMVLSFPLTRLLYGHQWDGSVDLTRLLALGMAMALPATMCQQALMASGRADKMLRVMGLVVAIQITCAGLGAMFGLLGAGIGVALSQALSVPIWLVATREAVGFKWVEFFRTIRRSALLTGITAVAPASTLLLFGLRPDSVLAPLASCTLFSALLFVLGARWTRHPIYEEIEGLYARFRRPG